MAKRKKKRIIIAPANWYYRVITGSDRLQALVTGLSSAWGPLLGIFAPAYFVWRSLATHLAVNAWVAGLMAGVLEMNGVALARVTLRLYVWNRKHFWGREKAPKELRAPFEIAASLTAGYVVANLFLTVLIEAATAWEFIRWVRPFVPAAFLLVSLAGYFALVMANDQDERERAHLAKLQDKKAKAEPVSGKMPEKAVKLPAWLPVIPQDLPEFRRLVGEGTIQLPEGVTSVQFAQLTGKNERTARNWLREVKNGAHG